MGGSNGVFSISWILVRSIAAEADFWFSHLFILYYSSRLRSRVSTFIVAYLFRFSCSSFMHIMLLILEV
ncbi:hypothetical protein L1987_09684 [Smallanthus sonchifolius]|uniref:Uncharacterized protein n=1 Tax=Smallanthus sonchifolius TaxID=185202 RepID=A0ACB9JQ29_9ASTR|nr:hypothetical protein L1987_09684 [Smallanthus sonchifolius]